MIILFFLNILNMLTTNKKTLDTIKKSKYLIFNQIYYIIGLIFSVII
jgi:hypothetical protein